MERLVVIGTGWSGSSAIVEYLVNRPDVCDPFDGDELRILHDPNGINDLYHSIVSNFSTHGSDNSIRMFQNVWGKESMRRDFICKIFQIKSNHITHKEVKLLVDKLVYLDYKGVNSSIHRQKNHLIYFLLSILRKLADKLNLHLDLYTINFPVDPLSAQKIIYDWVDEVFTKRENSNKKLSVIEQAGTFWNPLQTTRFCGHNTKVVLVIRDPLDVYTEIIKTGHPYPADGVIKFVNWYNQIFKRFNSKDSLSSNLKIIEFEKFILDFESKKHNIDTFLGLDPLLSSSFNPHLSQKNIGLFAERISKSESEYIKNKCISYKNIFNKAQFL